MDFGTTPHRSHADGISDVARMQSGSSGAAFVIDTGKTSGADRNRHLARHGPRMEGLFMSHAENEGTGGPKVAATGFQQSVASVNCRRSRQFAARRFRGDRPIGRIRVCPPSRCCPHKVPCDRLITPGHRNCCWGSRPICTTMQVRRPSSWAFTAPPISNCLRAWGISCCKRPPKLISQAIHPRTDHFGGEPGVRRTLIAGSGSQLLSNTSFALR